MVKNIKLNNKWGIVDSKEKLIDSYRCKISAMNDKPRLKNIHIGEDLIITELEFIKNKACKNWEDVNCEELKQKFIFKHNIKYKEFCKMEYRKFIDSL